MAFKYRPRLKVYADDKKKLVFDPEAMHATSYSWYVLFTRMNDHNVLNTYRYSVTTQKHVGEMRDLLKRLNVPFLEVMAPQGLQALDGETEVMAYAKAVVANKYARRKSADPTMNPALAMLGLQPDLGDILHCINIAEEERCERLQAAKTRKVARVISRLRGCHCQGHRMGPCHECTRSVFPRTN